MSESNGQRYRLVTRSDFDGLVCAALLRQIGLIDDIKFVHPKDMQDGKVEISGADITTNLPYVEGVHLAFDHHPSEKLRIEGTPTNWVMDADALSTARVVYDHFGGADRFPEFGEEIMHAVDSADAARFSEGEILEPTGWTLLSFLMDPRTGLGRFREFRISNYQLMMELIDACTRLTIDEIFELPDVKERVELYAEHESQAIEQIRRCSTVHDRLVVLDLRDEEVIHPTNRFMIYALYPECNLSIHVIWASRSRTRSWPRASRSSTARVRPTWASSCSPTAEAATRRPAPARSRTPGSKRCWTRSSAAFIRTRSWRPACRPDR